MINGPTGTAPGGGASSGTIPAFPSATRASIAASSRLPSPFVRAPRSRRVRRLPSTS